MEVPAERQLRWILRRSATLLELGAEPVRGLVLPNGAFFPDRFDGSPPSVAALVVRVLDHAGLGDLKVELAIVAPDGQAQVTSCSSGACGGAGKIDARMDRVTRLDDGKYRIGLPAGEVGHPVVLTTGIVRAVAHMFLREVDGYDDVEPAEREPLTDLAAVLLGFGVLAMNGAYIYMKGCSGAAVHSATRMPVDELAIALAIFCALHDADAGVAERHLDPTQREHFDEAVAWAKSNASTVKLLRANRRAIEAETYTLQPARSWLARKLGIGKKRATPDVDLDELERAMLEAPKSSKRPIDAKKRARLEELKALVDETLES